MLATVHGMFRCLPYESPITVRIHPDDLNAIRQPQVSNIINIASANTNCCVDDNIMNIDTSHTHTDSNTHSNTDSNTDTTSSDCPNIDNASPPLAVQGLEYVSTNIQNTDTIADIVKESIILEETIENIE